MRGFGLAIYIALLSVLPSAAMADGHTVSIFKMGGDIVLQNAAGDARLRTLGGSIDLGSVTGNASLRTNGGNIRVGSAAGDISATTLAGNIDVTLVTGKDVHPRTIELSSNSGSITLHVPHHFGATVSVTLTYTDNQSQTFHINENLGLMHAPASRRWNYFLGTPRKSLKANGTIGDGSSRIVISTINGNVTIVRG